MSNVPSIGCPVCGLGLKVATTKSQRGKVALVLVCPDDGRHFRGFINDIKFVRQVMEAIEVKGTVG